jgi:putative hydrolase of the HAD superfamily
LTPQVRRAGNGARPGGAPLWLFDLDDTLHAASRATLPGIDAGMTAYIARHLGLDPTAADALRRHYWQRYGATLLGLVRHHGVRAAGFLDETHRLPGVEAALRGHRGDRHLLRRLPGRKLVLTNAPRAYAERVLAALGLRACFDGVVAVEDMRMFGQLRPKPDARMLRRLLVALGTLPARCVLVEDSLMHQKAARRVGLRTVWMQRWLHDAGVLCGRRLRRRPPYVDLRLRHLQPLRGLLRGGADARGG